MKGNPLLSITPFLAISENFLYAIANYLQVTARKHLSKAQFFSNSVHRRSNGRPQSDFKTPLLSKEILWHDEFKSQTISQVGKC